MNEDSVDRENRLSRRGFLRSSAAVTTSAVLVGRLPNEEIVAQAGANTVPHYGIHQAGIATPAQESLCFGSFDLAPQSLGNLRDVFRVMTQAAANMVGGQAALPSSNQQSVIPVDTGEAIGSKPANLTVTLGIGRSAFLRDGEDVFGLGRKVPRVLQPIPAFRHDQLDQSISDGDICVQACSDNPQVAFHAVHTLRHMIAGAAGLRWLQLGFGRTSSTSRDQVTPRNLMGFKDGTDNIKANDKPLMKRFVWVGDEGPSWMKGGSYLVARRIEMSIEMWDQQVLHEQERTVGRSKFSGAPLSGHKEFDPVDLKARHAGGSLVIPADAHIRVSSPVTNSGQSILRRGYSFAERVDPTSGDMQVGLFFVCFQRDPAQFVSIQRHLDSSDRMNRYVTHKSNALFAIFPGVRDSSSYVGEALFD